MNTKRTKRLNSLLKEVLTEVIRENVRNPNVSTLFTITSVDITNDLRIAHNDIVHQILLLELGILPHKRYVVLKDERRTSNVQR